MKYVLLPFLIVGWSAWFAFSSESEAKPKYKIGQCFYIFDTETGKGDKRDILIIDNITKTKYIYRWWIYWTNSWATDTNDGIGKFSVFESMTKKAKCPK